MGIGERNCEQNSFENINNNKEEMSCPALKGGKSKLGDILNGVDKKGAFDQSFEKPPWFDEKMFEQGRAFYKKYQFACVFSNVVNLVMSLAFKSVIDVLVYTKHSDSISKSFWRYIHTLLYVQDWFVSDIFDPSSSGHRSLKKIRIVHQSVALRISKELGEPENAKWLSQADLALTIVGFSGSILISPKSYGISDHSQLEGYIHYWRVLAYLHGIKDEYNPFSGSLADAQVTIKDAVKDGLLPSLESPPEKFNEMVGYITSWSVPKNSLFKFGLSIFDDVFKNSENEVVADRLQRLWITFSPKNFFERGVFSTLKIIFENIYSNAIGRIAVNGLLHAIFGLAFVLMHLAILRSKIFGTETRAKMMFA